MKTEKTDLRLLLCLVAAGLILVTGCRDRADAQRVDAQTQITETAAAYRDLLGAGIDPNDDATLSKLKQLAAGISGIQGAVAGQEEAAAILAADLNEELGAIYAARAQALESEHTNIREVLENVAATGRRLEVVAAAYDSIDTSSDRAALNQVRTESAQRLQQLERAIADLEPRIAQLHETNADRRGNAQELAREANDLKRQAIDHGPRAGFESFRESVEIRREIDELEREIATTDIELAALEPERNLAQTFASHQETMITTTEQAKGELDALSSMAKAEATSCRNAVAEIRDRLGEAIPTLSADVFGQLEELYGQATDHYAKAAAAGRRAGQPGKAIAAGAQQRLGTVYAARAHGLGNQAQMLSDLAEAGDALGSRAGFERDFQAVVTARDAALENAKAAFTDALSSITQAGSRNARPADIEAFTTNVNESIATLEGREIAPPAPAGTTPATGGGTAAPAGGSTYETPEALLAYLQTIDRTNTDAVMASLATMHASTPAGQKVMKMNRDIGPASVALEAAAVKAFGPDAGAAVAGMGGMPNFTAATVTNKAGDTAQISMPGGPMGSTDVALKKVDGAWYIDVDALAAEMGPMLDQMVMMMGGLKAAMFDTAKKIDAGEYTSPDQVMQALMSAMMGGAGGAGGPGGSIPQK